MTADESQEAQDTDFPAGLVLNSFISTEQMLADVINVVPFCEEHLQVWSPRLATVILEACSQLDSLWQWQAKWSLGLQQDNFTIPDYFSLYGEKVGSQWLVFSGDSECIVTPFEPWGNLASYEKEAHKKLSWWTAYNEIKHNRLLHSKKATLKTAVFALSALFLAIIDCKPCHKSLVMAGWADHTAHLSEDSKDKDLSYSSVESRFFAYAVWWSSRPLSTLLDHGFWGGKPTRFLRWFYDKRGKWEITPEPANDCVE